MPNTHQPEAQGAQALPVNQATRSNDLATSKLFFFTAALLSLFASVYLFFSGQRIEGVFVGVWVPSILAAGTLLLAGGRRE